MTDPGDCVIDTGVSDVPVVTVALGRTKRSRDLMSPQL